MISSACALQLFASYTHFIWSLAFSSSITPAAFISCGIRISIHSLASLSISNFCISQSIHVYASLPFLWYASRLHSGSGWHWCFLGFFLWQAAGRDKHAFFHILSMDSRFLRLDFSFFLCLNFFLIPFLFPVGFAPEICLVQLVLAFFFLSQGFQFLRCEVHFPEVGRYVPIDKIEVNLNFLRSFNAVFPVMFMDKDFLHKLIQHGGSQVIKILILAVIGAVDVHLATAVGTVEQAGKQGGFSPSVRVTLHVGTDSLHILKSFRVDNGGMGILKDYPFIFVNVVAFLSLKCLRVLKWMVWLKYSRFFRILTIVEEPQP